MATELAIDWYIFAACLKFNLYIVIMFVFDAFDGLSQIKKVKSYRYDV